MAGHALEQVPYPAAEQFAKPLDGRQIDPRGRLPYQRGDGRPIEAGTSGDFGDGQMIAVHKSVEMTVDHRRARFCFRVLRRIATPRPATHCIGSSRNTYCDVMLVLEAADSMFRASALLVAGFKPLPLSAGTRTAT